MAIAKKMRKQPNDSIPPPNIKKEMEKNALQIQNLKDEIALLSKE